MKVGIKQSIIVASAAFVVGGVLVVSPAAASLGPGGDAVARATQAVAAHPGAVAASAADNFTVYSTRTDANGAAHLRYTRTYHGLRVYGGDIVVHLKPDGSLAGVSNGLTAP